MNKDPHLTDAVPAGCRTFERLCDQYGVAVQLRMSLGAHAAAVPAVLKFPSVAVVVLVAVCLVKNTALDVVVMSLQLTSQPCGALGRPMTPLAAEPPVPTLIVKVSEPLLLAMIGDVPKPLEIVGAALNVACFGVATAIPPAPELVTVEPLPTVSLSEIVPPEKYAGDCP